MFCNHCGAQIPDNATFCSKCGSALTPAASAAAPRTANPAPAPAAPQSKSKPLPFILAGVVLVIIIIAVVALRKPSLYGTWTDASNTIAFTFAEDGTLNVSGSDISLGVSAFTYTETGDNTLFVSMNSGVSLLDAASMTVSYEIDGDEMTLNFNGYTYILYKQ